MSIFCSFGWHSGGFLPQQQRHSPAAAWSRKKEAGDGTVIWNHLTEAYEKGRDAAEPMKASLPFGFQTLRQLHPLGKDRKKGKSAVGCRQFVYGFPYGCVDGGMAKVYSPYSLRVNPASVKGRSWVLPSKI